MLLNNEKIILLGLPGAGKTSLINEIKKTTPVNYVSIGEITRNHLEKNSLMAPRLRELFETSDPWPSDFSVELVMPYLLNSGYILDGVPRKLAEGAAYIQQASGANVLATCALWLDISPRESLRRILTPERKSRPEKLQHYEQRIFMQVAETQPLVDLLEQNNIIPYKIDSERNSPKAVLNAFISQREQDCNPRSYFIFQPLLTPSPSAVASTS